MRTLLRVLPAVVLGLMPWFDCAVAGDFSCPKPLCIPDRWTDADQNGLFDSGDPFVDLNGNGLYDFGELYSDNDGNGVYTPPEFYDPVTTGYAMPGDFGFELTLHPETSPNDPITPGAYLVVDLPPLGEATPPNTGAGWTATWFSECAPFVVTAGDSLQVEPGGGAITEATTGATALIAADPGAHWDEASGTIQGSTYPESPRSITVAAFDPRFFLRFDRNSLVVGKVLKLFVESTGPGSTITVRFLDAAIDVPTGSLPTTWGRLKLYSRRTR